ncbi:AraC family transcriptional regulator [Paenibacillus hunanensis]|uniref:AraC family transcriptional regulator n=1 Tax=Paenibacillus hunanensis TaxID=539262 RepID=UPI002A6AA98E|nr:AraC family transcriptional regulator [Paenibacillus hunanensis]WPP41594.1 AraC family transcriptional regulator [Paenibacillus hunanensis]
MPLNHTIYIASEAQQPMDLNLLFFGKEECLPGHAWGPGVRDSYILHYIHEGTGVFRLGDHEYRLSAGEGFLIPPDTVVNYEADIEQPWVYSWIGFRGLYARTLMERAGLITTEPVYRMPDGMEHTLGSFYELLLETSTQPAGDIHAQGILYRIMYELISRLPSAERGAARSRSKEMHIRQAIEYIENSYSQKITILDISRSVGLDRTYLSSLFKERFGMSLQAFMLEYRMNRAMELLHHTSLSVGEVSRSVGYDDPFLFSKMFKKLKGMSPKKLRNEANS